MRALALLTMLCMIGCERAGPRPIFFEGAQLKTYARCTASDALNARGSAVQDVAAAGDSNILVLYGDEREVVTYDMHFRPVSTVSFEREGPRGVRAAVSATTDGDLFYIADEKQLAVKVLDAHGQDRGTFRLDFIPRRVRTVAASIVVTPFVAGSHPNSLLYELRTGRPPRSLSIPTAHYKDGGINAFANMSSLVTFPDGRVVVMHETFVPFGYSLSLLDSTFSTSRFAVPLSPLQRTRLGKLPTPPLTERSLAQILAVALTATGDPESGHLFYLTRSGRQVEGVREKMIVELDAKMNYVRAAALSKIQPLHMIFAPARGSLIMVDAAKGWFECKL